MQVKKRWLLMFAVGLGLLPLFLSGCEVIVQVPPEACFTVSNTRPMVGEEVILDAVCSEARSWNGYIESHQWQIDGDYQEGRIISYVFPRAGSYTITLTVTDNNGQRDTTSGTVEVQPAPKKVKLWLESAEVQPGQTARIPLRLEGQADEIIIGGRLLDRAAADPRIVLVSAETPEGTLIPLVSQELLPKIRAGTALPGEAMVRGAGIVPQPKAGLTYPPDKVTLYAFESSESWRFAAYDYGGNVWLHFKLEGLAAQGIVPQGDILVTLLFYCPVIGEFEIEIKSAQAFWQGQSVQVELPDQPATITVGW